MYFMPPGHMAWTMQTWAVLQCWHRQERTRKAYLSYIAIATCLYMYICIEVYIKIYVTCGYICMFTCIPIYLPIYLSVSLSVYLSIYLAMYLSIYLSIYHLSFYISIYRSIHPSIPSIQSTHCLLVFIQRVVIHYANSPTLVCDWCCTFIHHLSPKWIHLHAPSSDPSP